MTTATAPVTTAPLSAAQRRHFESQGYLILRRVFSATEMTALAGEADRLLREHQELMASNNLRCRWQNHVETGACLFETFDPVIDLGRECAAAARDPRLLGVLAALYGEPARLFKDKLIYKPSGAKGYDLHQDFIAWTGFPRSFITAVLAIDSSGPENGCTEVFPGLHRKGCLTVEDGDYHVVPDAAVSGVPAIPLRLQPGDVALFGAFTPHRSAPNRSPGSRRMLYLSYNADSDGGDRRAAHYHEFHAWLKIKYAQYGKHDTYFR